MLERSALISGESSRGFLKRRTPGAVREFGNRPARIRGSDKFCAVAAAVAVAVAVAGACACAGTHADAAGETGAAEATSALAPAGALAPVVAASPVAPVAPAASAASAAPAPPAPTTSFFSPTSGDCDEIEDEASDALFAFCMTLLLKVVLESKEAVPRPIGEIWGREEGSAGGAGSGSTGGMRGREVERFFWVPLSADCCWRME